MTRTLRDFTTLTRISSNKLQGTKGAKEDCAFRLLGEFCNSLVNLVRCTSTLGMQVSRLYRSIRHNPRLTTHKSIDYMHKPHFSAPLLRLFRLHMQIMR